MATNATNNVINSTQHVCSGIFGWQQQYLTTTTFAVLVFVASVEALTCPFTILLNALVVLAVKRKHYLRKAKSHVLLVCLAGTDLLTGAIIQPLVVTSHLLRIFGVGPICVIDKIIMKTGYTAYLASLFHLVIMSCERYIAIKHALRYETFVSMRRLTIAVALAWATAVIIPLEENLGLVRGILPIDQVKGMPTFFLISISLLLVSFCQGAVLLESRRHRKHIKAHQVSESSSKELLKRHKAAITTTIIVGALFICFAPQMVFYAVALHVKNIPGSVLHGVMVVIDAVLYSNSLINPIIYCVRSQDFRRIFKEFLNFRSFQVHAEVGMNEESTTIGQRKDNNVFIDMPWLGPMDQDSSRSRHSLDLSKGRPPHNPRTRRTNSV